MSDKLADIKDVKATAKGRVALKNKVMPFVSPIDCRPGRANIP